MPVTQLRLATPEDDAVLRRFMRGNGMTGWVEMAIEREPSYFAGRGFGGEEWAVIARENEDVVGMYCATVRSVYVNGKPERMGYLGGLRVAPQFRRRIRFLRQGYASVPVLAPVPRTLPWWFTVVATDNVAAKKLLEAGLDGLPAYHQLGDYSTFALPTARGGRRGWWRRAGAADLEVVVNFHNARASSCDFAPVLDAALATQIGIGNFFLLERAGQLQGVAALWDQRSFKQIVAARYRRPIAGLVPLYNWYATLFARVPLPRQGGCLDHAFVAFFAVSDEAQNDGHRVLGDLLSHAQTPIASLGLHARHPLHTVVGDFKPISYAVKVYGVSFDAAVPATERPVQPEAAFL